MLGQPFPPIIAEVADETLVGELQDRKRLPLMVSESFTRSIQPLANVLFSTSGGALSDKISKPQGKGREIRLFGIKVKV